MISFMRRLQRSCEQNSNFFRDLIFMEVLELNGIQVVRFLLDQFVSVELVLINVRIYKTM
jgi:hypothetical protein